MQGVCQVNPTSREHRFAKMPFSPSRTPDMPYTPCTLNVQYAHTSKCILYARSPQFHASLPTCTKFCMPLRRAGRMGAQSTGKHLALAYPSCDCRDSRNDLLAAGCPRLSATSVRGSKYALRNPACYQDLLHGMTQKPVSQITLSYRTHVLRLQFARRTRGVSPFTCQGQTERR